MFNCPSCGSKFEVKIVQSGSPKPKNQSSGDIGDLLSAVEAMELNDWEKGFVGDLRDRYNKYKENIIVSDKQRAILQKILDKGF